MKCVEVVYDKRSKKLRECGLDIYGMTGLQELVALQRHMRSKHKNRMDMNQALNYRHESGQ